MRYVIDKSIFEPVEVEIGDEVFRAIPFSAGLIRAINAIEPTPGDDMARIIQTASLIFGKSPEEIEKIDLRALAPAIEYVTAQMGTKKPASTPAADEANVKDAIDEATASKNAPEPGATP